MEHTQAVPQVYRAIASVIGDLSKIGIEKDRKASGGGASYSFRGIDDVYNALAPLLAKHGLVMIPRVISREQTERRSNADKVIYSVVLNVEFDFVSALDGSKHTAAAVGEAMDSGDKASNKAMSAAYKYCALQTFCVPTEGDNDTENNNHGGIDEETHVAWDRLIVESVTPASLELVWKGIADQCLKANDQVTHRAMKAKVVARLAELKA